MADRPSGSDVFVAVLAYVPLLNLVALARRSRHRFVLFHTRQGLYLFSVFASVFVVLVGLAWLTIQVLSAPFIVKNTIAVLVFLVLIVYSSLAVYMMAQTMGRKMTMLPVLGELAGER